MSLSTNIHSMFVRQNSDQKVQPAISQMSQVRNSKTSMKMVLFVLVPSSRVVISSSVKSRQKVNKNFLQKSVSSEQSLVINQKTSKTLLSISHRVQEVRLLISKSSEKKKATISQQVYSNKSKCMSLKLEK